MSCKFKLLLVFLVLAATTVLAQDRVIAPAIYYGPSDQLLLGARLNNFGFAQNYLLMYGLGGQKLRYHLDSKLAKNWEITIYDQVDFLGCYRGFGLWQEKVGAGLTVENDLLKLSFLSEATKDNYYQGSGPFLPVKQTKLSLDLNYEEIADSQSWPQTVLRLQGARLSFNLTKGLTVLGGQSDFSKLSLQAASYFLVADKTSLAAKASLGLLSGPYPVQEQFYLGGTPIILPFDSLSPLEVPVLRGAVEHDYAGDKLLLFNFELRQVISPDCVTHIFIDMGEACSNLSLAVIKVGVGGGATFNLPLLGLVRFDLGKLVNQNLSWLLNISQGFSF